MREGQDGLPPRRSRAIQRKKQKVSLKRIIQGGLILFGTLFFGLIGLELYQAKNANPVQSEASSIPDSSSTETTPGNQGQTSTTSPQPSNEAPPPTNAESTEPKAEAKPAVPVVAPAPQPSTPVQAVPTPQTATPEPAAPAPVESETQTSSAQPKTVRHVVEKGDTLFKLSRKYYGNNSGVSRIARYNGLAADAQLTTGNVVIIPLSK